MDSDGSLICFFTLIFVLLIFVKSLMSVCRHSVTEFNDAKAKSLAETDKKYKRLYEIIAEPCAMIETFKAGTLFMDVCISFTALLAYGSVVSDFFVHILAADEKYIPLIQYASYIALMLLVSVLLIVFTSVIPERMANKNADRIAVKCVPFVIFNIKFFSPLRNICQGIAFVFSKLFGLSTSGRHDTVTEEEILMMVEAGNETGVIEESQREMINNIFEFGDSTVSDVMTHRTDIIAVDVCEKIHDIVYLAINEGFSRIPVYKDNIDTIIGIICVKDLLCLVGCEHSEDFNIKDFMRETMYIPETNRCSDVFETMTLKKAQMAVVVDEYGGTAGIVTIEDLLEEIVGNIQDEYDDDVKDFERISDNVFTVLGSADPEDILPEFGIKLPEEHNYDTMSAFIVDLLGRIPEQDEMPVVKYQNVEFTVLVVEDNWISKIKAVVCQESSSEIDA
ncbi:MAG: hemolysin family protein [Oscillospiraceae bacterium]